MKKRILTGIQSTGIPHLGNLLGSILPALQLSKQEKEPCYFFIADLHTLTTQHDPAERAYHAYGVAAAWLAAGLDTEKDIFYRQSRIPIVCELAWYLSTCTPYPMLANAHAFKEKGTHLSEVNAGLFTYPVLMAADILLYGGTHVPVGKDQQQHLEIARDIAQRMNRTYGDIFELPEPLITQHVPTLLGTDGRKMSKSYGNTINIFLPEQELRKVIMGIHTDSTPLEAPKDPNECIVFQLYSHVAPPQEVETMRENYRRGGYGYGDAKKALFAVILERFKKERELYTHYMASLPLLEKQLSDGEQRAQAFAKEKIKEVRYALGYN